MQSVRSPSIARTAALLLPVQAVLRAGEAVLPLLLAAWFGRSAETDAYYLTWAVFALAGGLVASAYQDSALVPVLREVEARDGGAYARAVRSLFGHALAYGAATGAVVAAGVIAWFGARGDRGTFELEARMAPAFAAYLVALGARSLFVGALNQRGRYFVHPVASGAGVAVAIGVLAGAHRFGVKVLPLAWLAQETVAAGIAGSVLSSSVGTRLWPTLERPEPVRRFYRLAASEVVGGAMTRLNPVIDQLVAGMSPLVGAGTVLRYALDVASLPTSGAQAAVFPPLLTQLATEAAERRWGAFERTVGRALLAVAGVLTLVSAALFVARRPLARLVFLHGAMDEVGAEAIADVLPYALVGVAPFGALLVLARAHVALQNSQIMVSMGLWNAGLNAALDVALFPWLGLRGVALATSAMQLGVAAIFWVRLRWKVAEVRRASVEPV